jgi:hypothetical protein
MRVGKITQLTNQPNHDALREKMKNVNLSDIVLEGRGHLVEPTSPEARVDWEKEASEILRLVKSIREYATIPQDSFTTNRMFLAWADALERLLPNALSAAFEKGREAR